MIAAPRSEVIPGPLQTAELVFRKGVGSVRTTKPADLTHRAHHLADGVGALLTTPSGATRLWHALEPAVRERSLATWLPLTLDGAIALAGADRGDIQILDPVTGALRLVASSGFDGDVVERFALVCDESTACGRAARQGRQVYIENVAEDELFASHRDAAAAIGFSSVLSTPLRGATGQLVGVLSTHWNEPHHLTERDLRLLDLHGDLVGDRLCQMLSRVDPAVPVPRDPRRRASSKSRAGPVAQSFPHSWFSPLMDEILASMWSTARALDQARGLAALSADAHHLEPAAAHVEAAIRHIRSFVLEHEASGGQSGWSVGPELAE